MGRGSGSDFNFALPARDDARDAMDDLIEEAMHLQALGAPAESENDLDEIFAWAFDDEH